MLKSLLNDEGQNSNCDAMQEAKGIFPTFSQLVSVNRTNNQAFILNGLSHTFGNQISSIMMGMVFLENFTHEIEFCFDLLKSETDNLPKITKQFKDKYMSSIPKVLNGINSSVRKLNQFTLLLSNFSSHIDMTTRNDLDLNQLVALCVSMTNHQILTFTNHFHLDLATDIPVMTGNPQLVQQVILNLLMNSLRSLPDRSCEVVLSTAYSHETDRILLCIRDSGIGISPDILPHIVEPFFTTWSIHGCLGLGLTVSDLVIRYFGGELSIESAPGKGTSALVSFPFYKIEN